MAIPTATEAWDELIEYARQPPSLVFTVKQDVPNTIDYDGDREAIILVSQHHAASGNEVVITQPVFERIWNRLQNGDTLSRPDEPGYTDLSELLDSRYRASGVMGMLDTVFDEIHAATNPVRIQLAKQHA